MGRTKVMESGVEQNEVSPRVSEILAPDLGTGSGVKCRFQTGESTRKTPLRSQHCISLILFTLLLHSSCWLITLYYPYRNNSCLLLYLAFKDCQLSGEDKSSLGDPIYKLFTTLSCKVLHKQCCLGPVPRSTQVMHSA